ncbi:hypothetical protein ACQJBY_030687 [Aegilops geniculata]
MGDGHGPRASANGPPPLPCVGVVVVPGVRTEQMGDPSSYVVAGKLLVAAAGALAGILLALVALHASAAAGAGARATTSVSATACRPSQTEPSTAAWRWRLRRGGWTPRCSARSPWPPRATGPGTARCASRGSSAARRRARCRGAATGSTWGASTRGSAATPRARSAARTSRRRTMTLRPRCA